MALPEQTPHNLLHNAQETALDGDNSSLYYAARALTQLQARFGAFPVIKGAGTSAAVVADLLKRMRREAGSDAPSVGGAHFQKSPSVMLPCVTPIFELAQHAF